MWTRVFEHAEKGHTFGSKVMTGFFSFYTTPTKSYTGATQPLYHLRVVVTVNDCLIRNWAEAMPKYRHELGPGESAGASASVSTGASHS